MKKLLQWFMVWVFALVFAPAVKAQGTTPDCVVNFTLTSASSSSTLDNRGKFCTNWTLVYFNLGYSALTLTIQAAPVAAGGVAGSWGTATGTFTGTHPATTATHNTVRLEGFHPFMRVTLSGLTGSGTVTGRLYGYRNPPICIQPAP